MWFLGLVVDGWVKGQLAQELAGSGVDDPNFAVVDEESDVFSSFVFRLAGLAAVLDIGLLQPIRQRRLPDTEVLGNLLQRHPWLTPAGDRHDVIAKLAGIWDGTAEG